MYQEGIIALRKCSSSISKKVRDHLGPDFGCVVEMKCQSAKIMRFHNGGIMCRLQRLGWPGVQYFSQGNGSRRLGTGGISTL